MNIEQDGNRPKGSEEGLKLYANTEYTLTVHYQYPMERPDTGRRRILVRMGTEINRELAVGSVADRLVIPFNLPPLDFSAGAIIVETTVEVKGSTGGDVRYTANLPFRTQAWRSNLLLFGLLLLVSFLDEFRKAGWDLSDATVWLSTFFEFLKFAIVVWAVFKYGANSSFPAYDRPPDLRNADYAYHPKARRRFPSWIRNPRQCRIRCLALGSVAQGRPVVSYHVRNDVLWRATWVDCKDSPGRGVGVCFNSVAAVHCPMLLGGHLAARYRWLLGLCANSIGPSLQLLTQMKLLGKLERFTKLLAQYIRGKQTQKGKRTT